MSTLQCFDRHLHEVVRVDKRDVIAEVLNRSKHRKGWTIVLESTLHSRAWLHHNYSFSASHRFQSIEFHIMSLNPECVYLAACRFDLSFSQVEMFVMTSFRHKMCCSCELFQ